MTTTLTLPAPAPLSLSLEAVLKARRTNRDVTDQPLDDATLSAMLWASGGITSDDGRRTTPSTLDLRLVDVYVLRADGAWHFNAKDNTLVQTTDKDVREVSTAYQFDFVKTAPVTLVFVADNERGKDARPGAALIDAGTMGQNAYLAMTSLGLGGGIRASFDHAALRDAMALPEHLEPILLFTVGHKK